MLFELALQSALVGATLLAPGIVDHPSEPPACKMGSERIYSFEFKSGDTLEKIFDQVGAGPWSAAQLRYAIRRHYDTKWVPPGARIDVGMSKSGVPRWFRYRPNITAGVCAVRDGRGWQVSRLDLPIDRDVDLISLTAEPTLAKAIENLGEDPSLADLISEVFPIKKVKSIQLLVEKLSIEGDFLTYTRILAAEAKVGRTTKRAFFFEHPAGGSGYYTQNAEPMGVTSLYHPVPNSLEMSKFGVRRHPMLRIRRNHKGIDYAAPMDTMVHAAADGMIVDANYYGPLGRMVVIDHGRGLITRYAHLNRYGPGIRRGVRVRRGDPIGHIGTSGLSTGAHLHFETLLNENHVNPARVSSPPPLMIPEDLMPVFEKHVSDLLEKLDLSPATPQDA